MCSSAEPVSGILANVGQSAPIRRGVYVLDLEFDSGGSPTSLHHSAINNILDLLTIVFPKFARRRRSHDNDEPFLRVTEELGPIGAIPGELARVAWH